MKLPVLSYTFLNDYKNCPRKAWHKYVAKDLPKFVPTPEMQKGIDVHEMFKYALRQAKVAPTLPPQIESARPHLEAIVAVSGTRLVEEGLAITSDGSPCGFWDEKAWLRGKIDVVIINEPAAFIADWKTGKCWEDPFELEVFALLLSAKYRLSNINGCYMWLRENKPGKPYRWNGVEDLRSIWQEIGNLDEETKRYPIDREWEPTPNKLCPWCPVATCEYCPVGTIRKGE